uniref:Uncharacterized protein n=1 Tax=Panagrolaimus sp. ES5 TaxID=591445 RepID=A0AC34G1T7_9BILA
MFHRSVRRKRMSPSSETDENNCQVQSKRQIKHRKLLPSPESEYTESSDVDAADQVVPTSNKNRASSRSALRQFFDLDSSTGTAVTIRLDPETLANAADAINDFNEKAFLNLEVILKTLIHQEVGKPNKSVTQQIDQISKASTKDDAIQIIRQELQLPDSDEDSDEYF